MQLESLSSPGKCLTSSKDDYSKAPIGDCKKNSNDDQKWKLGNDSHLKSLINGKCLRRKDGNSWHLKLDTCGGASVRWTCLPFALKSKNEGRYLVVHGDHVHLARFQTWSREARWKKFRAESSISNYTGNNVLY